MVKPIFYTTTDALENNAYFKRGQSWLKKN